MTDDEDHITGWLTALIDQRDEAIRRAKAYAEVLQPFIKAHENEDLYEVIGFLALSDSIREEVWEWLMDIRTSAINHGLIKEDDQ